MCSFMCTRFLVQYPWCVALFLWFIAICPRQHQIMLLCACLCAALYIVGCLLVRSIVGGYPISGLTCACFCAHKVFLFGTLVSFKAHLLSSCTCNWQCFSGFSARGSQGLEDICSCPLSCALMYFSGAPMFLDCPRRALWYVSWWVFCAWICAPRVFFAVFAFCTLVHLVFAHVGVFVHAGRFPCSHKGRCV